MKKALHIIIISVLAFSCERDTDQLGPSLIDVFGLFSVFEEFRASSTSVDFTSQTVIFSAVFSKQVNWEIHVIGQQSGAEKVLTGFSSIIDASNGGVWNGTTTILPMFKKEDCLAYLRVTDADTLFLDTLANLIAVNEVKDVNAFIVTDWENGLNEGFSRFVQSGANMNFDTVMDIRGAEGNAFYEFSGEVTFINDLGNIGMPKDAFTDTNFTLSTNDERVFFNVFARRGPSAVQDIFVFQFMEDDNGDGVYQAGDDDMYEYVINSGLSLDWQQFSVQYTALNLVNAGGNQQRNPDRLVRMVVLPIGVTLPFEGYLDYLVFTENKPLSP
jgi:hypothetical protein